MKHILTVIGILICAAVGVSCQEESDKQDPRHDTEAIVPGMMTRNVSMLISDSGVIRYKAEAPMWLNYNLDPGNKYQYFPEGILLTQIDSLFNETARIEADTAYNYENDELWHLIKNVRIMNTKNERFITDDLYWDMRKHTVYSDSFIRIEQPDAIIEGYGFESNDDFSRYSIRQTSGIFPIRQSANQSSGQTAADSVGDARRDSLRQAQRHRSTSPAQRAGVAPDSLSAVTPDVQP